MARLRLISLIALMMSGSALAECRDVVLKSTTIKAGEKAALCFFNDDTYFISKNCQDLSCGFMTDLRKKPAMVSPDERPGAALCKELSGIIETLTMSGVKHTIQRCLFVKEKTFISLNLLESWDGKKFLGPSEPN